MPTASGEAPVMAGSCWPPSVAQGAIAKLRKGPSVKPKGGPGQKSPNAGAGRQPPDREVQRTQVLEEARPGLLGLGNQLRGCRVGTRVPSHLLGARASEAIGAGQQANSRQSEECILGKTDAQSSRGSVPRDPSRASAARAARASGTKRARDARGSRGAALSPGRDAASARLPGCQALHRSPLPPQRSLPAPRRPCGTEARSAAAARGRSAAGRARAAACHLGLHECPAGARQRVAFQDLTARSMQR